MRWTDSPTYWGEQTTSVGGKEKNISENDLIKIGKDAGLTKSSCTQILHEIQDSLGMLSVYLERRHKAREAKIPIADRIEEIQNRST